MMNSSQVKGTLKTVKGKVREEVGHATGDDKSTIKGVVEQVAGKVQKKFGDIKENVKEKVDHLLHPKD